jgi:hypothetical protein
MIHLRSASLLLALGTVLVTSPGWAQTGGTTGTSTTTSSTALQQSDFKIRLMRQDGKTPVYMTDVEQQTFFNQANCQCQTPLTVRVELASASRSKVANPKPGSSMRLLIGTASCLASDGPQRSNANCYGAPEHEDPRLKSDLTALKNGFWEVPLTTRDLFAHGPTASGDPCSATFQQSLWFWIDADANTVPDLVDSAAVSLALSLDGTAPAAPTNINVEGGNEALNVNWPAASTADSDLAGYLLFCTRVDRLRVFEKSLYHKQYYTKATTCPTDAENSALLDARALAATTNQAAPAVSVAVPAEIAALNSDYLCSTLISTQATSFRLETLQNDYFYTVGLAAVDKHGNASAITTAYAQKTLPTVDFYRAYRDAGGEAEGGYCTLAHGRVRTSALVFGVLGVGVALALRRRARRSRGSRILFVLFPLLVTTQAQAQTVTHDFDDRTGIESSDPNRFRSPRNWAFELRFGPYVPNVDSEFNNASSAPQKTVMGTGHHLMSQFELDWELFHAIGTLGVGLQAGYMSETAKAFKADTAGAATTDRSGDDTTLRIMPVAALAVYRMDLAAEYWHIPLVPYAKAGLNYTFWSITDGNGNTPKYKGGKGKGGTPGWQAAVGIALQLDFIDPSAARSFDSDMGVNHTCVFFEWNHVAANGLGQSGKLHLGDSTWVAGLMFEF